MGDEMIEEVFAQVFSFLQSLDRPKLIGLLILAGGAIYLTRELGKRIQQLRQASIALSGAAKKIEDLQKQIQTTTSTAVTATDGLTRAANGLAGSLEPLDRSATTSTQATNGLTHATAGLISSLGPLERSANTLLKIAPDLHQAGLNLQTASTGFSTLVVAARTINEQTKETNGQTEELIDKLLNSVQAMLGDMKAATDEFDARAHKLAKPGEQISNNDKEDYWDEVREKWKKARVFMDKKVESIGSSKMLKKYVGVTRYTYYEIADSFLTKTQYLAAYSLNQTYIDYRPQKYVLPKDVWQEYTKSFKQLTGAD
jgi:uncharacterized phage infection (PIP) family protein YhgE